MNRTLTRFALAAAAAGALLISRPTAAASPGAGIFIAGEATGNLTVFNEKGALLDGGAVGYSVADGFAVGDLNNDGADDIVIAGDVSHQVEIRSLGNVEAPPITWNGDFTIGDALATGNVLGGYEEEIVIVGDGTGRVDIYNMSGVLLRQWISSFNVLDKLAIGNVTGDGKEEILVVGDVTGNVDVYDADGNLLSTIDLDFDIGDGFAAGDLDGSGFDEIIIAGDLSGNVDVFDYAGTWLAQVATNYSTSDGFAVGDVDRDGKEEFVIAGDVSGDIDIYDYYGANPYHFDGDYTVLDGLAVGSKSYPDDDADGLLDNWETDGFDADGDTTIDVDLPGMGCKYNHKDLLLEFDWVTGQEPTRFSIQRVIQAFTKAPIDAGGTPNPDVLPGIHLVIDTGSLTDPNALEGHGIPLNSCTNGIDEDSDGLVDGADDTCVEGGPGGGSCRNGKDDDADGMTDANDVDCTEGARSCSDGVDNDGDTTIDAADASCLVGDNYGGGNAVSGPIDPIGSSFYAAKATNFATARRRLFRYGIAGNPADADTGGRGEIGGNDFVEYNHDGGTIMHEFGHNLNLHHGGSDDDNCKPNFVSVMNYDHQGGITRNDGSSFLDYSPPRRRDDSRSGALPEIVEDALDETMVFDPTDHENMFNFTDDTDAKRASRLDRSIDWDGDGDTDETNITVNVDDEGTDGNPKACGNVLITTTLIGHDDWSAIQLNFRGHADYDDSAVNPVVGKEPTRVEMAEHDRILNRANLAVTMTDSADPAVAGTSLEYVTTVRNMGPNPTNASHLAIALPNGVTHVSTAGCFDGDGTIACDLGMLFPGEERVFTTSVMIDAALVHLAGAPTSISATANIRNIAGDDPTPANDSVTQATLVKAVADLEAVGISTMGAPPEILIGKTASLSVHEQLTSHGPSSPMDTRVTRTVAAPADANVSIAVPTVVVPALAQGETRETVSTVDVACTLPGHRSFTLTSSVSPARPDDTDPVSANNDASTSFDVECVVPVSIRILPRMNGGRNGVVPVEIRSNAAGEYGLPLAFDASRINALSVRFGSKDAAWQELGGAFESHGKTHGGKDRMLHFNNAETGLVGNETEACVKGTYTEPDGDTFKFFGCDVPRW